MALAALRWTLDELAARSGVARITVARFHQPEKSVSKESISAMQDAMEKAGAKFEQKSARLIVSVPEAV